MERETNNEAEYCGLILGPHRAVAAGFTAISIRGDSRLVIDQITGRARCAQPKACFLDQALRNVNAEADAAANAGLRARMEKRRILFYDDLLPRGDKVVPLPSRRHACTISVYHTMYMLSSVDLAQKLDAMFPGPQRPTACGRTLVSSRTPVQTSYMVPPQVPLTGRSSHEIPRRGTVLVQPFKRNAAEQHDYR